MHNNRTNGNATDDNANDIPHPHTQHQRQHRHITTLNKGNNITINDPTDNNRNGNGCGDAARNYNNDGRNNDHTVIPLSQAPTRVYAKTAVYSQGHPEVEANLGFARGEAV